MNNDTRHTGVKEFIALVASMTALVALAIDAMLPALPQIAADFRLSEINDAQLVIGFIFIGMAIGPPVFGPVSDAIGRKKTIYFGMALFVAGSVISYVTQDYFWFLVGRVLQGLGVSGPRIVAMAMVRDRYQGREMARVMSLVTTVFILVPALAPSVGQWVMHWSQWRDIFLLFIGLTVLVAFWLTIRQPETLSQDNVKILNLPNVLNSYVTVLKTRQTIWLTLATGCVFGSFLGYLNSSQQLFQDIYGITQDFPLYFAVLALGFGSASLLNAKLVVRIGMYPLAMGAVTGLMLLSVLFMLALLMTGGRPPFGVFFVYALLAFMMVAILFGNLNAMAMAPLGHVAGTGAAIISTLSTLVALPVGVNIGLAFNQTLYPITVGFILCSVLAMLIIRRVAVGEKAIRNG